ncbi:MAG: hypothetical protein GWP06_08660 [Actinobacteria bacterium]|nr:hypothetical protein [Actinomycetota bacterium]
MYKILLLDDDIDFVIEIQKLFPRDTEWLATIDSKNALELLNQHIFDFVIVRKHNETLLQECLALHSQNTPTSELKLFKRVILLPKKYWKRQIKKKLFQGG